MVHLQLPGDIHERCHQFLSIPPSPASGTHHHRLDVRNGELQRMLDAERARRYDMTAIPYHEHMDVLIVQGVSQRPLITAAGLRQLPDQPVQVGQVRGGKGGQFFYHDSSFYFFLHLQNTLPLMRDEGALLALIEHGRLEAFDRVPDVPGDVHSVTALLATEDCFLLNRAVVIVRQHPHLAFENDDTLILRRMMMDGDDSAGLQRIQEPVALFLQATVEIQVLPQALRRPRLGAELRQ